MINLIWSIPLAYLAILFLDKVSGDMTIKWLEFLAEKYNLNRTIFRLMLAYSTSVPEIAINALSLYVFREDPLVGLGTIIGSAIFQLSPVISFPLLVSKNQAQLDKIVVFKSLGIFGVLTTMLIGFIITGKTLVWWEAGILALTYTVYMVWAARTDNSVEEEALEEEEEEPAKGLGKFVEICLSWIPKPTEKTWLPTGLVITLLISAALCALLMNLAGVIGDALSLSALFMSVTLLAGSSSGPELSSGVILAKKGQTQDAVASAIDSNGVDTAHSFGLVSIPALVIWGAINIDLATFSEIITNLVWLVVFIVYLVVYGVITKFKLGKWFAYGNIALYILYVVSLLIMQ